jgi:hypothetical protein
LAAENGGSCTSSHTNMFQRMRVACLGVTPRRPSAVISYWMIFAFHVIFAHPFDELFEPRDLVRCYASGQWHFQRRPERACWQINMHRPTDNCRTNATMLVISMGPFGNESQLLCPNLEQVGTACDPACQQLHSKR